MLDLILLQAESAAQQGSQWSFWIMMLLMFVVFYFFMIRPLTKKQKEKDQQRFIQKGDKVVTDGGLYGYVVDVRDDMLVILIGNGVNIEAKMDTVKLMEKAKHQSVNEIVCPKCGMAYDANYEFCPHCGEIKVKTCQNPQCRCTNLPIDAEYCPMCGQKL